MRTWCAFMASLIVAFVVLSALADRRSPQRIVTGTTREFEAGQWLSVATHTTDPKGVPIALRETTAYEGSPAAIKPGARVTVWYRSVGERRFVADKVRVLTDAATR
jgi:ABC-type metal ion transport system substrate-binding protein